MYHCAVFPKNPPNESRQNGRKRDGKNVLSSAFDARKVLPFAFFALALLVALTVNSMSRYNDLLRSQEWVSYTHLVLHEMDEAEDSLQDAREAELHYILTPEQEDLNNFQDAVRKTWVRVERISDMTRDDEGYPERVEKLRGLIEKEFRQSQDNMRTTKTLLIFHSPQADANRDHVRAAMQKLKDDEKEILRIRSEAARSRARGVERSVFLLIGGFSALVAVLFLLVIQESKKRRSVEPLQQLPAESMAAATADGRNKTDSTIA